MNKFNVEDTRLEHERGDDPGTRQLWLRWNKTGYLLEVGTIDTNDTWGEITDEEQENRNRVIADKLCAQWND